MATEIFGIVVDGLGGYVDSVGHGLVGVRNGLFSHIGNPGIRYKVFEKIPLSSSVSEKAPRLVFSIFVALDSGKITLNLTQHLLPSFIDCFSSFVTLLATIILFLLPP